MKVAVMRHAVRVMVLATVMCLVISAASAQTAGEKIGQVSFPISCNPAVQKPFERRVALLHSFWYLERGWETVDLLMELGQPSSEGAR
jgi:hypothetical protein